MSGDHMCTRRWRPIQWRLGPFACQESKASPSPETIDLCQSGVPHPLQLRLNISESVLGIVIRPADEPEELAVKLRGGRGDDLQVGEQPTSIELLSDLRE